MAHVDWSAGIDSVSGALAKPSKDGQHSCDKMLLGTHRVAATTNDQCTRIYLRKKRKRSTPLSTKEVEVRSRFEAVAKAVKARKADLMQMSTDQQAFLAQKDQAGGKKTLRAYLWLVCGQEYDSAHQG
jgi:hypothetical protein